MIKISSKVQSPASLQRTLKKLKSKNSKTKVVFTNGCFDLLHRGHVTYLEQAKSLGDILVVALNSDASVTRLKGKGRPVNKLKDRAWVLGAVGNVDFVTWFSEDNPISIIKKLRPDILVKGGDWNPKTMLGAKEVLSWGGKVAALSYVKGRSTTQIISQISET